MSNFRNQDWQVVFTKAAFQNKHSVAAVQLVENVDDEFIKNSKTVTYMLTNLDVAKSHLGADVYYAQPVLERIFAKNGPALPGQTLQITAPQILKASSSEAVLHTVLRYAFVFQEETFLEEEPVETEAERIAREEEEELQALMEEEEREKEAEAQRQREAQEAQEKEAQEKAEKERLENEQKEREAEAARLREAENAQQNSSEPSEPPAVKVEQAEDDQFEEEQR